jgi:ubiquitin-protein ligase
MALYPYEVLQAVNEAGEDNMLLWNIVIDGPTGTPYEGGKFRCKLTFPKEFPNHMPHFAFETQIFHPNLPNVYPVRLPPPTSLLHLHYHNPTFSSSPQDIIGIGPKTWKTSKFVPEYIGNVIQLLREPAPDDAVENEACHLYQSNRAAFTERARRETLEYAKADA